MAKNSVRDFDATAANNTDIQSVDIAENCAPSGINNAIRELMADIKDVSSGTIALESPQADSLTVTGDLTVDTNTLFVDASANAVGIGTSSPSAPLEISTSSGDALKVTTSTGRADLWLTDTDTTAGQVRLRGDANNLVFITNTTERMRIDSSGNLGIGTSSPSYTLTVQKDVDDYIAKLENDGNSTSSNGLWVDTRWNTATNTVFKVTTNSGGQDVIVAKGDGNVGIGTSSPSSYYSGNLVVKCDVSEGGITIASNATTDSNYLMFADGTSGDAAYRGYIGYTHNSPENMQVASSGYTRFYTGDPKIERMRISATSPALSIGKTTFGTAGGGFTVYGNTAPQCYFNKSQSGAVNGILFYYLNTYVGGLNYTNTNTSLATSSDERLKDNIENSDDAGAKIDAMQVRQFDWKSTGEHQEYGFVAQELEPVFAHAVHTDKEGDYKSVDYACLVPMLVKEIQSLRQRIADLENA